MKKLNLEQMEVVQGGDAILGCGLLGLAFGFVNPFLGAAVSIGCGYYCEANPSQC